MLLVDDKTAVTGDEVSVGNVDSSAGVRGDD